MVSCRKIFDFLFPLLFSFNKQDIDMNPFEQALTYRAIQTATQTAVGEAIRQASIPPEQAQREKEQEKQKQEQKQKEFATRIGNKEAKNTSTYVNNGREKRREQRISRRLLLAERAEMLTVSCSLTGAVTLLAVPAIKGYALSYTHPLAVLENARGIAQQGLDYLRILDTQTLAAILITLAADYNLFAFAPSDSGAQKNAVIRTAGKDIIIDAIILIETFVNSGNFQYIPRLSLLSDIGILEGGFEARMLQWLKVATEAIYKPDLTEYDENKKPVKYIRPAYIRDAVKAELAEKRKNREQEKIWSTDKKQAIYLISVLSKAGKLSVKLKNFLSSLFSDDLVRSLSTETAALLELKLNAIVLDTTDGNDSALLLISIIHKHANSSQDIFDDPIIKPEQFLPIASSSVQSATQTNTKPRTLQEILAAKKQGE